MNHNFRPSLRGVYQGERQFATEDDSGLLVCTWPHGGRPDVPTRYSDEVWTGLEYELAALLLYLGEPETAVRIVSAARARYDGHKQNPWNDVECGDHYVRALASWSLLEAAAGFRYHAAPGEIAFAPALDADDFRAPFVARDGWGTYAQRLDGDHLTVTITLATGTLSVGMLRLRPPKSIASATVTLADRPISASVARQEPYVALRFIEPISLHAGEQLSLKLH